MAEIDRFTPARNQDAWATLRGFRVQIDLSILRWLSLQSEEYLELERGEDIDLVVSAMSDDSIDGFTRKLEQVKVRDRKVSLDSTK